MISLESACRLVEANNPFSRIIRCFDYDSFYGFMLVPRSWEGKELNLSAVPANNSMNYIQKDNGKEFFLSFYDAINLLKDGSELDIEKYLTPEDAAFAAKVRKML